MTMSDHFETPRHRNRKAPVYVVLSAWLTPVMVLGGWAFLAVVPVALVAFGTWTNRRVRPLRWWAAVLAGLYAIPFVQYLTQDSVPSMSKMLHPAMGGAIAVPAAVIIVKLWRDHRH